MAKIYRQEDFKQMPWKNGQGVTLELISLPHCRLSKAKVESSGPFSLFPGIDRCLILLEGEGFALSFQGKQLEVKSLFSPIHFPGEEEVSCRLIKGACQDFNIMVNRLWGEAMTEVIELKAGSKFISKGELETLLYVHHQGLLIHLTPGEKYHYHTHRDEMIIQVSLSPRDY